MTAGTLIRKTWEELGEPSDLNPATIGVPKLITALNDAQDVVAQWIDNRGRKVYFRELEDNFVFQTVVETGTFTDEAVGAMVTMPVSLGLSDQRFVHWVMAVGSEVRNVVRSVVLGGRNVLTVSGPFNEALLGQTFVLAKREYQFSGTDALDVDEMRVVEMLRIIDAVDGAVLEEVPSAEHLTDATVGVPGSWKHKGSGLLFDAAPLTVRNYIVQVMRLPTKISEQTDVLELPDAFAQAIQMRMVWWGFRRMQDFQAAYATKKDFEELMTRLATASWMNNEPDYFTLRSR